MLFSGQGGVGRRSRGRGRLPSWALSPTHISCCTPLRCKRSASWAIPSSGPQHRVASSTGESWCHLAALDNVVGRCRRTRVPGLNSKARLLGDQLQPSGACLSRVHLRPQFRKRHRWACWFWEDGRLDHEGHGCEHGSGAV